MRIVIQRVKEAKVVVKEQCIGAIGKGFLVLLGVGAGDTKEIADRYIDKILKLRIFADDNDKTNLSLQDVQGEILVVSQFTLYADCRKGNRPDFIKAAGAEKGEGIIPVLLGVMKERLGKVEAGEFGASMEVSLVNDGPFTIILDESLI